MTGTASTAKPLCIDLDGTVVLADTFLECIRRRLQQKPRAIVEILRLLLLGRAHAKRILARTAPPATTFLPYCDVLLKWLRGERARGRKVVLVTGADENIARSIATHVGLFDEVYASDGVVNLTGSRKAEALVRRFGPGQFEYVGNSLADIPIWREAGGAVVVNPGILLRLWLTVHGIPLAACLRSGRPSILVMAKALRVYQWSKNLLVLVPLALSHRLFELERLQSAIAAAFAFSLTASSVYLVNDVLDMDSDREHPEKRRRPVASGELSPLAALPLSVACFCAGIAIAGAIAVELALLLGAHAILAFLYSARLKRLIYLDVMMLCCFYGMRILAGGLASGTAISPWLIQFSLYAFLSLSIAKRYSELGITAGRSMTANGRRGYVVADMDQLALVGTVSAAVSVLVVALYIHGADVQILYRRPYLLWALCPILLYWFLRLWALVRRGHYIEDPVFFALTDKPTYLTALLCLLLALTAM